MSVLIICLACLVVWIAPVLIAFKRKHQSKMAITVVILLSVGIMAGYTTVIVYAGHMSHGSSLAAGLGVIISAFLSIVFWLIALIWSLAGVKK